MCDMSGKHALMSAEHGMTSVVTCMANGHAHLRSMASWFCSSTVFRASNHVACTACHPVSMCICKLTTLTWRCGLSCGATEFGLAVEAAGGTVSRTAVGKPVDIMQRLTCTFMVRIDCDSTNGRQYASSI